MCETYTLETTAHCWEKLKNEISRVKYVLLDWKGVAELLVLLKFSAIRIKIPSRQADSKIYIELQWTQKSPTFLKNMNILEALALYNFKFYCKATVTAAWHRHEDRRTDQWDRIKSSEISRTCVVSQSPTTVPRPVSGERIIFSTKGAGTTR